jgi:hypothetical protein
MGMVSYHGHTFAWRTRRLADGRYALIIERDGVSTSAGAFNCRSTAWRHGSKAVDPWRKSWGVILRAAAAPPKPCTRVAVGVRGARRTSTKTVCVAYAAAATQRDLTLEVRGRA